MIWFINTAVAVVLGGVVLTGVGHPPWPNSRSIGQGGLALDSAPPNVTSYEASCVEPNKQKMEILADEPFQARCRARITANATEPVTWLAYTDWIASVGAAGGGQVVRAEYPYTGFGLTITVAQYWHCECTVKDMSGNLATGNSPDGNFWDSFQAPVNGGCE